MRKLFLFALVTTMFAACATDEVRDVATEVTPETLTISFEDADSRIQLENGKTVWTKGDLVSVFYRSNANQKWQFQGKTGDRTGNLKRVEMGVATETMNRVVAVYPYAENYYINPETYNIEASLPAEQTYLTDSYGIGGNIMVSYGEYNQVVLKSVCGWLKIQLTGNGEKVKSIKLKGNNGEQVAGQLYINSADATAVLASEMGNVEDEGSAGGNLVFEDTVLTEVSLNCGEGVELGAEATAFYIALPPQTFEKGFTIELACADGSKMVKSSRKTLTIERNHIQPMTEFAYFADISPSNVIWYTTSDGGIISPRSDAFGVNILSNTYINGIGTITLDGDVTKIEERAFEDCSSLTTITIPESVTEIGKYAFNHCSKLTAITIPNSVVRIYDWAFYDCSSLTSVTIPYSALRLEQNAFCGCKNLTRFYGKYASNDGRCLIVDGVLNSFAPAGITDYTITDDVTCIGEQSFMNCKDLLSITIPNSVTLIKIQAFDNCTSLKKVTIPDSVYLIDAYAFMHCSNLTNITIPKGVQGISVNAFANCSSLMSVYCESTQPPMLGKAVFAHNADNRKIYVPASNDNSVINAYKSAANWSEYADAIVGYNFETGEVIPEAEPTNNEIWYTSIDGNIVTPTNTTAFDANILSNTYNNGIGIIKFDKDITVIDNTAFYENESIVSIIIPNGVTSIGRYAFTSCDNLANVSLPKNLQTIGIRAFYFCRKLMDVKIPDSVTTIKYGAFLQCESFTKIHIPNNVTTIEESAFSYCTSLEKFNGRFSTDDGLCLIADTTLNSFAAGSGVSSYIIPDYITDIGDFAFMGTQSLTSVTIGNNVKRIGWHTFCNCNGLESIVLPSSLSTIQARAFIGCTSLKNVYCKSTIPPSGGSDMFDDNASDRKIYVPRESVEVYKAAEYWSEYADAIEGYDF